MEEFEPISLSDKGRVDAYLNEFGGGSCQHSFAALYAFAEKYGTRICEFEDCLLVRQPAKDEGGYISCLMPLGKGDRRRALGFLKKRGHEEGKRLKLQTITEEAKKYLEMEQSGVFEIIPQRDYAEYLYEAKKLVTLEGSEMKNVRQFYNRFQRNFKGRTELIPIRVKELTDVLEFQEKWLFERRDREDYSILCAEGKAIERVCAHFEELGFVGMLVRVDGQVCGYALGCGISDKTLDIFFEKGDTRIRDIYRCLVTDMIRMHGAEYEWVNREEDLGDEGMRYSKLSYRPDRMLNKYIALER